MGDKREHIHGSWACYCCTTAHLGIYTNRSFKRRYSIRLQKSPPWEQRWTPLAFSLTPSIALFSRSLSLAAYWNVREGVPVVVNCKGWCYRSITRCCRVFSEDRRAFLFSVALLAFSYSASSSLLYEQWKKSTWCRSHHVYFTVNRFQDSGGEFLQSLLAACV